MDGISHIETLVKLEYYKLGIILFLVVYYYMLAARSQYPSSRSHRPFFYLNLSSFDLWNEHGKERLKKACSEFAICYENEVTAIHLWTLLCLFRLEKTQFHLVIRRFW